MIFKVNRAICWKNSSYRNYIQNRILVIYYKFMYKNECSSKNYWFESQSAANLIAGSSETLRPKSIEYVAGVIDGDGNFDVRSTKDGKRKLKSIRIKLNVRDLRVLARVKNILKCGSIRINNQLVTYHISTKSEMERVIKVLNGHIRLKVKGFIESCKYFNISYISPDYIVPKNSFYLSGLIDTDGSISYNYSSNVITLTIELKQNEYSELLNLDYAIPGFEPKVYKLIKRNQTKNKTFYSIRFDFTNVNKMIYLYNFAMKSRLYSDFKFYRFCQIKSFLLIRHFKIAKKGSDEHKAYSKWVINFISNLNPNYTKVTYFNDLSL